MPIAKFVTHSTLMIAYILFWAVNLCGWPWLGSEWMHTHGALYPGVIHLWEVIIWAWTALRFLEELQQFMLEDTADYLSDLYNLCDLANYFTAAAAMVLRVLLAADCGTTDFRQVLALPEGFGAARLVDTCLANGDGGLLGFGANGLRHTLPLVVQLLYGSSLLLLCGRSIGILKIDQQIGVLVISLGEMFTPILYWSILTLFITFGFSVFFVVTMPAGTAFSHTDLSWPGLQPFWGLLGEFGVDSLSEWKPPNDPSDPTARLLPLFLWAYCFVSTVVLVNLLIAQMSSAYSAVEERAPIVWTFDFTSELVREFKDTRRVEPAPFNIFRLLLRLPLVVLKCSPRQLVPPPSAADRKSMGFKWEGGSTRRDRKMRAAEHQRRQAALRGKYLEKLKDESESSIEAQVELLTRQQQEMDTKQEQRLETVLSTLARLEGGGGGGSAASPTDRGRAAAATLGGASGGSFGGGGGGGGGGGAAAGRGVVELSVPSHALGGMAVRSPQRLPSPAPTSVMRGAATPAAPRGHVVLPPDEQAPEGQALLSRRHEDLAVLASQPSVPPSALARPLPVRDVDLRHGRNPRMQLAQMPRKPSPRSGASGQPLSISFAL